MLAWVNRESSRLGGVRLMVSVSANETLMLDFFFFFVYMLLYSCV